MPCTITCKQKSKTFAITREAFFHTAARFAQEEGTFLCSRDGVYTLSLFPCETLRASSWQELRAKLLAGQEWVGFFSYEGEDSYFQRSLVSCVFDGSYLSVTLDEEAPKELQEIAAASFWSGSLLAPLGSLRLFCPMEPFSRYREKIRRVKEYIKEGEIYQVNLSHEVKLVGEINPFTLFVELIRNHPSPFAAYGHTKEETIISASPERLLCKKGSLLCTRPIKGTMPRGKTKEEDDRYRQALMASAKERAELIMITDLMRNDLGKIARLGSVAVTELLTLEEYTNVFHLVSEVQALAMSELGSVQMMQQVFPGGSVTGCPKKRACEIIEEIEQAPRGIYTGSIGCFFANGDFDFNIAIRTMVKKNGLFSLRLGGGIVIDSDEEKEYEETLHKGRPFFRLLGLC